MNMQLRISKSGHMMLPSQIFFTSSVLYFGIGASIRPIIYSGILRAFIFIVVVIFSFTSYIKPISKCYLFLYKTFYCYLLLSKSIAAVPVKTTVFFPTWFLKAFCLILCSPPFCCLTLASNHFLHRLS